MAFLILGLVLGAFSIIFAMDNSQIITVNLLGWQYNAPMAIVLLSSMVLGIMIALASMVPAVVRRMLDEYTAKREARKVAAVQQALAPDAVIS